MVCQPKKSKIVCAVTAATSCQSLTRTLALQFAGELVHSFALMLWAAGLLAFVAGMEQLGLAIFAVVIVNAIGEIAFAMLCLGFGPIADALENRFPPAIGVGVETPSSRAEEPSS